VKRSERASVACFGEVLWDIFELDPPGTTSGARYVREIGGAPANVATVLARLGVHARIVGGIGRDHFGTDLAAALGKEGVDGSGLVRLAARTGLTFVRRDKSGEPSFLFYRHETADVSLGERDVTEVHACADYLLVGTSTLMNHDLRRATSRFVKLGREQGASLLVDLNVRAHMWKDPDEMRERIAKLLKKAAIVKASETDLRALTGASHADVGVAGEAWLAEFAPKAVWVLTRGSGPATAVGPFGRVEVPSRPATCVDATGAGDAFIAGVLATLAVRAEDEHGKSSLASREAALGNAEVFREALTLGHRLGEKAISKPGAVAGVVALAPLVRGLRRPRKAP
jgi:fructokinase